MVYFVPPLNGLPWNLVSALEVIKLARMMGLQGWERSLTISLSVWIQYTSMTERWTDNGRQQRPCLTIAFLCKNACITWLYQRQLSFLLSLLAYKETTKYNIGGILPYSLFFECWSYKITCKVSVMKKLHKFEPKISFS